MSRPGRAQGSAFRAAAGCGAAVLLLLAGASSAVELRVPYLPAPEDTSIRARCQRAVLAAFREQHPHIELSAPSVIEIPEMSAMDTRPLMAIAGGVSPDVLYVNFRQSDTYIREGFLYPLDRWMDTLPEAELAVRVLPQVRPVVRREGPAPGGKVGLHWWALPYATYVKGLCWRKDLFQAAGLDPERAPADWAELLDAARRCTDSDRGTYGLYWSRSPHWSAYFYSLLCSAGARAMTADDRGDWRASFNTPEAVTAYTFALQLLQGEWVDVHGRMQRGAVYREPAGLTLWAQGRIAMMERYFSDDLLVDINPELVGLAPVPAGPAGRRAELNCAMLGIYSGAARRGADVLDAAWRYVAFMGSAEAKAVSTRVLVENGYGMFANPVHLEQLGYTAEAAAVPPAWRAAWETAVREGEPEPYGRNCQMIYNYMSEPMDRMLLEGLGLQSGAQPGVRVRALLDEYTRRANERMVGEIPADARAFRRGVAAAAALLIAAGFAWLFRFVATSFHENAVRPFPAYRSRRALTWLLLPALGSILLWRYVPLAWGACIAFQDFHLVLPWQWSGWDNLAGVLWDPEFWQSLGNSLWYSFLSVVMGFLAPIVVAIILHELPRGSVVFRTLYYLPAMISGLVVMLMWKSFFDPAPSGLLNRFVVTVLPWLCGGACVAMGGWGTARAVAAGRGRLWTRAAGWGALGATAFACAAWLTANAAVVFVPQRWLDDPFWAMPCVVLPTVWAGVGPGSLIYLAALKTIPEELYEAAEIDGAGIRAKLGCITFPSLRVLIVINFIGAVINAFRVSEYILAMTGGGPAGATRVLALKVFYDAFVHLRFGMATAAAWILGALLIGLTALQMKRLSRVEYRRAT